MAITTPSRRGVGRPPKTEAARAAQRAELLAVARKTIRDRGPRVAVDELAAAAGVSKPVLYDHFGDKAGLAQALAEDLAKQVQQDVTTRVLTSGELSMNGVLRGVIDAFVGLVDTEISLHRFIVHGIRASEVGLVDNALAASLQDTTVSLLQMAMPGVDRAVLEVASYGLFGQVFLAVEAWAHTHRMSREKLVDTLVTLAMRGLVGVSKA
jgi:AcrR family transcriptional regulator